MPLYPLVYYCVYGEDSYYDCLRASLTSLLELGGYTGFVGVACDRPKAELLRFVPGAVHARLITTKASAARGWFGRYDISHGLYDRFSPILYADIDVVFDRDIAQILATALIRQRFCCATEALDFADQPPAKWPEYTGDYFGRYLYLANGWPPVPAALGNTGFFAFDRVDRVKPLFAAVSRLAEHQDPERLRMFGDQPIVNYLLHTAYRGDFLAMNRYVRIARSLAEVPPETRNGIVHFNVHTGEAKIATMLAYLENVKAQISGTSS